MARIKKCDLVVSNMENKKGEIVDGFTIREDLDPDAEYVVEDISINGKYIKLLDSDYWYPTKLFDLAPLSNDDIVYSNYLKECKVIYQDGSKIYIGRVGDECPICTKREDIYKIKSYSVYYYDHKRTIYINNVLLEERDMW